MLVLMKEDITTPEYNNWWRRCTAIAVLGSVALTACSGGDIAQPVEGQLIIMPNGCDEELPPLEELQTEEIETHREQSNTVLLPPPDIVSEPEDEEVETPFPNPVLGAERYMNFYEIGMYESQMTGLNIKLRSDGPIEFDPQQFDELLSLLFDLRHNSDNPQIRTLVECYYERMVIGREREGALLNLSPVSKPHFYYRNGLLVPRTHKDDIKPGEQFVGRGITAPLIHDGNLDIDNPFFTLASNGSPGPFWIGIAPGWLEGHGDPNQKAARIIIHELAHLMTRLFPVWFAQAKFYLTNFEETADYDEDFAQLLIDEVFENLEDPLPEPLVYVLDN